MAITFSVMADNQDELMGFLSSLAAQGFLGKMAAPPIHARPYENTNRPHAAAPQGPVEPEPQEAPVPGCRDDDYSPTDTLDAQQQHADSEPAEAEEPVSPVERLKRRRRTKAEMQAAKDAELLASRQETTAERHPLADVCDAAEDQADKDLKPSAPAKPAQHAHTHSTHTPNGSTHTPAVTTPWTKETITALVRKAQKSMPTDQVVGHIRACGYGSISAMPPEKYQELANRINARLAELEAMNRKF